MRQSAIFRCPLSAQKTAFLLVSGVLRRAKSFESGRGDVPVAVVFDD
jgi:hypothetical protein